MERLGSDPRRGLTGAGALERLGRIGANELPAPRRVPLVVRLARALRDPMSLLLVGAAAISALALGEYPEAVAILVVVLINAVISVAQEARAEAALDALRELGSPDARVVRDGHTFPVPARDLVPGDVLLLAEGDAVPADGRLIEADGLMVDESRLTGESLPIEKDARAILPVATPVADRANCVYSGTLVVRGSARAIVTATGMETEMGAIASTLQTARPKTPLQRELAIVTKRLAAIAIAAGAVVLPLALWTGDDVPGAEVFLMAVSLAVAAVPEGLATVIAVALAIGVFRMAGEGAIVRRLPAVETLGETTVIATDKTGTLTENRLTVRDVWAAGDTDDVAKVAVICNDASLAPDSGDPLDVALLHWAGSRRVEAIRREWTIEGREPFDSDRRFMRVRAVADGDHLVFVKGAPEAVFDLCGLEGPTRSAAERRVDEMAGEGLKVIACALSDASGSLRLTGLVGTGDPIRSAAHVTVERAQAAGIRVVMVTGDHPHTARAIARQAGIPAAQVMLGGELEAHDVSLDADVYARTTPQQKLTLVRRLQELGEVVAVTGDGVNDAPALHKADIGVAMGRGGTQVARNAADMVVTDDDLATIVTAVREGRGIYANIRRVVHYLASANLSEIMIVLGCLLAVPDLGVPLLPLQLLWINLVTDVFPALGLGLDRVSNSALDQPPRRVSEALLGRATIARIVIAGGLLAAGALGALLWTRTAWGGTWAEARTALFLSLVFGQLLYPLLVRRTVEVRSRPDGPFWSNRWLLVGVAGGGALQLAAMSFEGWRELFELEALPAEVWVAAMVGALLPSVALGVMWALGWVRGERPPLAGPRGTNTASISPSA